MPCPCTDTTIPYPGTNTTIPYTGSCMKDTHTLTHTLTSISLMYSSHSERAWVSCVPKSFTRCAEALHSRRAESVSAAAATALDVKMCTCVCICVCEHVLVPVCTCSCFLPMCTCTCPIDSGSFHGKEYLLAHDQNCDVTVFPHRKIWIKPLDIQYLIYNLRNAQVYQTYD